MSSTIPFTSAELGTHQRPFDPRNQRHESEAAREARINVGGAERVATTLIGGALAAAGLALVARRRSVLSGLTMAGTGAALLYRGASGHCGMYEAVGVDARDAGRLSAPWSRAIHVERTITIGKSRAEVYAFWSDFANLPKVMRHLERVDVLDRKRSHWVAKAPAGKTVEWDAVITEDRENEVIAWETAKGVAVAHTGRVEFKDASAGDPERGTLVRVTFDYQPVGGAIAALVAKVFGEEPKIQVHQDLRRLKSYLEAGEMPTTDGQPRGTCDGRGKRQQSLTAKA